MSNSLLTPAQEDYLEAIHRVAQSGEEVRITSLASRLGCKLPTVTRTIKRLVQLGVVAHESRGVVNLTRTGRATAEHLVLRHHDVVQLLTSVLGLSPDQAETDACKLEHGLSPLSSQRLHQWLAHLERMDATQRLGLLQYPGRESDDLPHFHSLNESRSFGWRG